MKGGILSLCRCRGSIRAKRGIQVHRGLFQWSSLVNFLVLCIDSSNSCATHCCKCVVKIVSVKESLNRWAPEKQSIFFHLLSIFVFPIIIRIFGIKIVFIWWDVRSLYSFVEKIIEWVVLQPWMLFDFFRSIKSESIDWFSLKSFINEISCFKTPSFWDFMLFDLHLFCKDVVPNFFSTLP